VGLNNAGLSDAGLSDVGLSNAGLSDAGLSYAGLSDVGLSEAVFEVKFFVLNEWTDFLCMFYGLDFLVIDSNRLKRV
jgi:uncharacterized protein YjbI with pentapeptide repeats